MDIRLSCAGFLAEIFAIGGGGTVGREYWKRRHRWRLPAEPFLSGMKGCRRSQCSRVTLLQLQRYCKCSAASLEAKANQALRPSRHPA
jgi:hypothetical protein